MIKIIAIEYAVITLKEKIPNKHFISQFVIENVIHLIKIYTCNCLSKDKTTHKKNQLIFVYILSNLW